ncbi:MAG: hypothetical protein QME52_06840 [Bacteroidota bacterium]|nr:hypothetical protein [Bacteroidota bacterium]
MKSIRNTFLPIISLFLFVSLVTRVQAGNGGSGYSRYGLGDINHFASSRFSGMGGASIGSLSNNSINQFNPAAWSSLNRTRYEVSLTYQGFTSTDWQKSAYLSETFFNGFMITLPILPRNGMTLGLGVTPFSRINYHVIMPGSFNDLQYRSEYIGTGGLSRGRLGLSGIIFTNLHLGIEFNYLFGTSNYTTKQKFDSSIYSDAEVLRSSDLKGVNLTFGAIYSGFKNLFNITNIKSFNAGLIFTTSSSLTSQEEKLYTFYTPFITSFDTLTSQVKNIDFPFSFGFGLSLSTERILLVTDFHFQNWGSYKVNGISVPELRNSYRLGFGGELLPKKEPSATLFRMITYRLGFFFNATSFQIKTEPVDEIGITGGIGIPIFGDTRIDVGLEYSYRGTTLQQLQQDNIIRINITLSGSELWFERPERD